MRVHVFNVGHLRFPRGALRHMDSVVRTLGSLVRRVGGPEDTIPILSYLVEHDEGHIVIDTGLQYAVAQRFLRSRFVRRSIDIVIEPDDEIGPQMRARGLRPEDVRLVLPTHLDVDHAGGIGHFPSSEIHVHRPEWDDRRSLLNRLRFMESSWPSWFSPKLYDLPSEPLGSFGHSHKLTDAGDVVAIPTPGHTKTHVAIVVRTPDINLLFAGDHLLRQSWFIADLTRGVEPLNFFPRLTRQTNAKLRAFMREFPTMLLPSHDAEAAENIARREPLKI